MTNSEATAKTCKKGHEFKYKKDGTPYCVCTYRYHLRSAGVSVDKNTNIRVTGSSDDEQQLEASDAQQSLTNNNQDGEQQKENSNNLNEGVQVTEGKDPLRIIHTYDNPPPPLLPEVIIAPNQPASAHTDSTKKVPKVPSKIQLAEDHYESMNVASPIFTDSDNQSEHDSVHYGDNESNTDHEGYHYNSFSNTCQGMNSINQPLDDLKHMMKSPNIGTRRKSPGQFVESTPVDLDKLPNWSPEKDADHMISHLSYPSYMRAEHLFSSREKGKTRSAVALTQNTTLHEYDEILPPPKLVLPPATPKETQGQIANQVEELRTMMQDIVKDEKQRTAALEEALAKHQNSPSEETKQMQNDIKTLLGESAKRNRQEKQRWEDVQRALKDIRNKESKEKQNQSSKRASTETYYSDSISETNDTIPTFPGGSRIPFLTDFGLSDDNSINMINAGGQNAHDPLYPWGKRKPKVEPPKKFKGNGEQLPEFKLLYDQFIDWEGIIGEEAAKLLAFRLEGEAWDCYQGMSDDDKKDKDKIFENLEKRFCSSTFKMLVTEKLRSEKQGPTESIDQYISRFSKVTRILDLTPEQKISEFITNLDGDLKEHFLVNYPIDLADAFQKARVKAAAQNHNQNTVKSQVNEMLNLQKEQMKKTEDIIAKRITEEMKKASINQIMEQPNTN